MDGPSDGEASRERDEAERSLAWGWVASLAAIALAVAVLVGAAIRTPGTPDCDAYSAAGWLVACPWVRQFLATAAVLFGVAAGAVVVLGFLVGVARSTGRARRDGG